MDFSHYLHGLINPGSIAVVGASEREGSYGTLIWNNLLQANPKAKLYAVNPKYKKIGSARSYASLLQIRAEIELAIIVSPPGSYIKALEQAVEKNIPYVMLCGGYPKIELTPEIFESIRKVTEAGTKVIGPQTLGLISPADSLNASFISSLPPAGSVGLISQSPGLSCCVMNFMLSGLGGFSRIIDPGLEYSVTAAGFIEMLAYDRQTRCIALYLESFQEPRKLLSAIRTASARKPVLLLKGGQTPGSADIIVNNNGAREDEDGIMEEALRKSGALLVGSLKELNYAIQVFSTGRELAGKKYFGLVNSKGLDSLLADHAYKNKLEPAEWGSKPASVLQEKYKIAYPYANPINAGLDTNASQLADLAGFLLGRPECSALIVGIVAAQGFNSDEFVQKFEKIAKETTKPVVTAWIGAEDSFPAIRKLREAGIPAVTDLQGACKAFRLLQDFRELKEHFLAGVHSIPNFHSEDFEGARKIIRTANSQGRHLLYEEEAKKLLAGIGFETTAGISAGSFGEVVEAARALGYPLSMKVRTDGILSKSEIGGVILGIRNERELKSAWKNLSDRVLNVLGSDDNFGVFLQKTLDTANQRELKIGMRVTRHFGPVVFLGIGGLYGSVFAKPNFNFAPLSKSEAQFMISEEPFRTLLNEYKGLGKCNTDIIVDALLRLSAVASEIPALRIVEIDPLLCGKNDAIVLDAHCVVGNGSLYPDDNASHLILPYRSAYEKNIQGRFGSVKLKNASASDRKAYLRYLSTLSDNSRRLRFHSGVSSFDLIAASAIGYDPDKAFSLVVKEGDEMVGEARFTLLPNGKDAEFGVSVRDDRQGLGIASVLMAEMESEAQKRKIRSLIGYVLKDNSGMSAMMTKRGYSKTSDKDDPHINLFTLHLPTGSN